MKKKMKKKKPKKKTAPTWKKGKILQYINAIHFIPYHLKKKKLSTGIENVKFKLRKIKLTKILLIFLARMHTSMYAYSQIYRHKIQEKTGY